jgi:hypothetical protein
MRTLGSSINRFFEAHLFACLLAGSTVGWLLDTSWRRDGSSFRACSRS